nr:MAG TPA: hypothetical protein [Caudoviricetes sp.]
MKKQSENFGELKIIHNFALAKRQRSLAKL